MTHPKYKVGDIIFCYDRDGFGVRHLITKVRKTGYTWKYPDIPDQDFLSENSNDPLFQWSNWIVEGNEWPPIEPKEFFERMRAKEKHLGDMVRERNAEIAQLKRKQSAEVLAGFVMPCDQCSGGCRHCNMGEVLTPEGRDFVQFLWRWRDKFLPETDE